MSHALRTAARSLAMLMLVLMTGSAFAQTGDRFYAGKTLTILVGSTPGGYYDIGARIVARYLGRFIPGNPNIIVQNQPGGGGLSLANRMANGMERDGLTIVAMNRALPQLAMLEDPNVTFDPMKLTWLGSLTSYKDDGYMLIVNKGHKAKSFADALAMDPPIQLGGTAAGSTNIVFGLVARDMLKARVGLIRGFPGVSEVWLAMERGELDGQVIDLSAVLVGRADAWRAGQFRPLVVFGRKERMAQAPDAPTARELVKDPEELALLDFAEFPFFMAFPFAAPPGIPADRAAILSKSFMAMATDQEFRAEVLKAGILTSPIDGEAILALIAQAAKAPRDIRQKFARLLGM